MSDPIAEAHGLLQRAEHIAILSHERPDGDAIGSLLALSQALRQEGKRVASLMGSGVPGRFKFLPGADKVVKRFPDSCDLLVTLDCADDARLGFPLDELPRQIDINIDHHPTNTKFGAVNLVQPETAATAEILYGAMQAWELPLTLEVVTNLLVGLLTDTIGFRTSSTTPQSLRIAADLMELGAPLSELYDRAIVQMSFIAAQYWGGGLARLEKDNGLVWTSLTLEDRRRTGYPGADDADLVNLLMTIEEARVVVLFVEQPGEKVKVSWRAEPGIDVSAVATQFGGGGHRPAAGAMLQGRLEEMQEKVLTATRQAM